MCNVHDLAHVRGVRLTVSGMARTCTTAAPRARVFVHVDLSMTEQPFAWQEP